MTIATVTITLTDNADDHTVRCHSNFTPAVGGKLTPAQSAGIELMLHAARKLGLAVENKQAASAAATHAIQVQNYGSTPA